MGYECKENIYVCNYFAFMGYLCNDLFSRFEQQILFLEKLAETTDPTTDRRGGLISKHLEILKNGY